MKRLLILLIFSILIFSSCEKDEDYLPNTKQVSVNGNLSIELEENMILVLDATHLQATGYLWQPTKDTTSAISVKIPGDYKVFIFNQQNIIDSFSINIFSRYPILFIPNSFTPNSDALNDCFFIEGFNIKKFEIIIFNQDQVVVFKSDKFGIHNYWGGYFNGEICPQAYYYYIIKYSGSDNKERIKKGMVHLVR
ncbi:MAG: gliding motility-associated C-terminal domain-containing protein [Bacteroidota bacterium]|nr:gliding motility-associated C-terminal domain-containing protein [Bacteroidota bacterium]